LQQMVELRSYIDISCIEQFEKEILEKE